MPDFRDPLGYYAVLGLDRDASSQDVKRAFRRVARECHPDVAGDDPQAAERFKRARRAYEVLSDPEARSRYDASARPRVRRVDRDDFFRSWWERHRSPRAPTPADELDLDDIFGAGSASGPEPFTAPSPGPDLEVELRLDPRTAALGGPVELELPSPAGGRRVLRVQVPPGARDGQLLRLARQGAPSPNGGPPGDLLLRLRVPAEPFRKEPEPFRAGSWDARRRAEPFRSRLDPLPLPLSVAEALLGATVEVPTPIGPARIEVPPCTSSGVLLDWRPGYAFRVEIACPPSLDEASRRLVRAFAARNPYDPRRGR